MLEKIHFEKSVKKVRNDSITKNIKSNIFCKF